MSVLTFCGYLKRYVRRLSFSNTNSLYKLAAEAASKNPRLREPLFLYALFFGKEKVLLAAAKSPELHEKYAAILERYDQQRMEQSLQNGDPLLPYEYAKVYRSYLCKKDRSKNEAHSKSLMREKIIKLQCEKNVTNYRIYTDLCLNPGNMNAFLKHGNCSKVSRETARKTVFYLERI